MFNSKQLLAISVLVSTVSSIAGLKCISCYSSKGFEDCDIHGYVQQCMPNQNSCETVVRRYNNNMIVMKGCKNEEACRSNQIQNKKYSGKSRQCNSDQHNSICTCCCGAEFCNAGIPSCVDYYRQSEPVRDCPQGLTSLPHGEVVCHGENKAGSVCEFQCTGNDYSTWPKKRDLNVCLGNGTWAYDPPCCARPCPPYYLLDDVEILHVAGDKAEEGLKTMREMANYGAIANDALKISVMYHSGEPIEETVVKFNEYGEDVDKMMQLIRTRMKVVNEGTLSTGKAIQYALDNLFVPEAGMRDDRVAKSLGVLTNVNLSPDAKGPVEEAKRRGILFYVMAFEEEGYEFDRDFLVELTGDPELVYIFGEDLEAVTAQTLAVMDKYFCRDPCDHVMHAHE